MRKTWIWALLLALLLSACAAPAAPEAAPTATPSVTATPAPTAAPTPSPSPDNRPTPEPSATPAPRWVMGEESVSYMVLTQNLPNAEALCIWLLSEGRAIIAAFGEESLGEPMFSLSSGLDRTEESVPAAADETRYITLAADQRLLDSGLMEALLPAFESRYGYSVELLSAPAEQAVELAREADIAILAAPEANALRQKAVFYSYWPLASTDYVREDG